MSAVIELISYAPQPDLGTPAPRGTREMVSLSIDGQSVEVAEGTSVMRAPRSWPGFSVPKLCASDSLEAFGSCRVCLVEIDGRRGTPASCTTPVEAGMVVSTNSEKLGRLRKNVIELYLSDHNADCNGECELHSMAAHMGISETRYGPDGLNHQSAVVDDSNPYFQFDASSCIVCYRCVRACEEIQGTFALTVDGRGFDSVIAASQLESFMDSECVSCGACVDACPTTALNEKVGDRNGCPGQLPAHHLCLLRRRLHLPRRAEGQ